MVRGWLITGVLVHAQSAQAEFYRDVLPILQDHCQGCHRRGEIGPMPLGTYQEARPYAAAIKAMTQSKQMPPWFADAPQGQFSNDPSLTVEQIATLARWADTHAPAGNAADAPKPPVWTKGWKIDKPDLVLRMPNAMQIPAAGDIPYQYIIIPTDFKVDRWVRMCEIRPSNRQVVHHAVAYVREPGSDWLQGAPVGKPFSAEDLSDPKQRRDAMWTTSDILLVYAPGSLPDGWGPGYAKLIPAGSDIVLQMHYVSTGMSAMHGMRGGQSKMAGAERTASPAQDQTSIGLVFADQPTRKRVLTLQLTNDKFLIPPGDPNHQVEVHGTVPNDCELLSFFPHMHLRGKSFEYTARAPNGKREVLLNIPHYDFFWQLSYRLVQPIKLRAGTVLEAVATFDNSKKNPHNPDPDSAVTWGEQTWAEMMVGFFDVAVDARVDKERFFIRKTAHAL